MTEPSSQEPTEEPESNSLDLSALQSFSFGTQWTDAGKKPKGGDRQGFGRSSGQGRRPDRRGPGGGPGKDRRPPRRFSSDKGPRGDGRPGQTGERREGGDRRFQNRGQRFGGEGGERRGRYQEDRPYESSVFEVGFYPDDTGFSTIIKALRTNHITYELFHVAKIFLEKSDRYVASVTRKAAKGESPERVYVSVPDGMPFQSEEEAIQHAVTHHAESLFDTEEVEVEAPKGNFPFVNRCGITKKLIGPPNYHRYEEFLNLHHKTQLGNMPFEKFKASIEQVREEEAVNEWLESMKKTTRYTSKAAEGEEAQVFDSLNDAIGFLRTSQREQIVKVVNYARVSGVVLDKFSNTEASRAVAGELARQRRFPLETANAIRGRLRREKFSIYKKGAKGVTLICATRRNFRKKGQVMSDTLDRLLRFLEAHQNIKAKEVPAQFETWLKEECPDVAHDEKKLFQDLHWLIADGYVSHFSDDSLFAQPVMENEPKAAKKPQKVDTTEKTAPADPDSKGKSPTEELPVAPPVEASSDSIEKGSASAETVVVPEKATTVEETNAEGTEDSPVVAVESPPSEEPVATIPTESQEAAEVEASEETEPEEAVSNPEPESVANEPTKGESPNAKMPPEKPESTTTVTAEEGEENPQSEKAKPEA